MHTGTAWILLLAAGVVEIVMALALKQADGWTRLWPSLLGVVAAALSIILLTIALRSLPVGTAYAVFTGIGAIGITAIGVAIFGEGLSLDRILYIALIFAGIVGLRLSAPS